MRRSWYAPALVGLVLSIAATVHAQPPTVEEVGDADSFGRSQIYLGVANAGSVLLQEDCTPDPNLPPQDLPCIPLLPQPQLTTFRQDNLDEIRLPARATNSLICFAITPFILASLGNDTPENQSASLRARAVITLESAVLNDPELINPSTGLPFGGSVELNFGFFAESRSFEPGEEETKTITQTRDCSGGLINRRALLEGFGLSEKQAREFFRQPIRLVFGVAGSASLLRDGSILYGTRLYGDR